MIINAPSYDKKSLENVENGYIELNTEKYGKKLINIKSNPLKKVKVKKIQYNVEIENEQQLRERIAKLEIKLIIKDDEKNKLFYFDAMAQGKRVKTMTRYNKKSKEEALKKKINKKKQEKIEELTVYFR